MAEFMHLTGTEEVSRAASTISAAANEMRQAAGSLDATLHQFTRLAAPEVVRDLGSVLSGALDRFESLVQRLEALNNETP